MKLIAQLTEEGRKYLDKLSADAAAERRKVERGRVEYRIADEPGGRVAGRITDDAGREWMATGANIRDAYDSILAQLEEAAGAGDGAARDLLGIIEAPPGRAMKPNGPALGGLL